MHRRQKSDLEDWEAELFEAAEINLGFYQKTLDWISDGGRVVEDYVGDITDTERRKAEWKIAHYKATLARYEFDLANDNDVYADEELSEIIQADW